MCELKAKLASAAWATYCSASTPAVQALERAHVWTLYDEWQVGDSVAHAVSRTVTETDNVLVSALTHNPQPMHLDHEVAAASEFGKPLVNSIYTFGLMVGVSVSGHYAWNADRQPWL